MRVESAGREQVLEADHVVKEIGGVVDYSLFAIENRCSAAFAADVDAAESWRLS